MNLQELQLNTMTLGEIAAKIPGATAVFRHYELDFCCAGNRLFTEALSEKGLDRATVAAALTKLKADPATTGAEPGAEADDAPLIDYIITRYHDTHRDQFPELIRLAGRVEKVHAEHPFCPKNLESLLTAMFDDLSEHMEKEEQILFPLLRDGQRHLAAGPIMAMESQHADHGRALATIRELTHNRRLPEHACNTWRALYQGLAQLEEDLIQHIHLENNILFAR